MKTITTICLALIALSGCNTEQTPATAFYGEPLEISSHFSIMITITEVDSVELPEIKDSAVVIKNMAVYLKNLYSENDSLRKKLHEADYKYSVNPESEL